MKKCLKGEGGLPSKSVEYYGHCALSFPSVQFCETLVP